MDYKLKILEILEKLRQKSQADKEPFKARAYATVIKNLKASDKEITKIEDIKDIKGIGKSIYDKIQEILNTGELKQVEKYNEEIEAINNLLKVHGIGPVKAKELVEKNNIKTIEALKEHKELLNDKQLIGLKYVDDINMRIERKEMDKHNTYLIKQINEIDPKFKIQVVGSYRRGAKDSGDIDVIVTHEDNPENYDHVIKDVVAKLREDKYLHDDLALGAHKYLGVCKLKRHKHYRRIDILYATKEVWPFSVMYFTGSADFNIIVRKVALEKGLSMSEYGFKKDNELVNFSLYTEEDIFKYLGLEYVPPEKRSGSYKF
jgi:DNA polymerase/3'-5' exonuclease PolX